MNRILVSQRLVIQESYGEVRACLDEAWGAFFHESGALPVPLLTTTRAKDVWDGMAPTALVLTGGNDLSRFSSDPLSRSRDELETLHLEQAIERGVPVFGICRGAQFIADYFHSTLEPIENHIATRHGVALSSDTAFGSLGEKEREVNSYHGYGITKLGLDLKEIATAGDGSIEAFEHKRYPMVGVMWHPEREPPSERVCERDLLAAMIKKRN